MAPKQNPLLPVVRVAPLGELNAYAVYEHELDILASGSPGSNFLGISYALIPFSSAFLIALFGTDIPSNRVFNAFVLTALVTGVGVLFVSFLAYRTTRAIGHLSPTSKAGCRHRQHRQYLSPEIHRLHFD